MTECTPEYTWLDLRTEAERQSDRPSFHVFSEPHIRGQIMNFQGGGELRPARYEGALLVTGIAGSVDVTVAGVTRLLRPLCQLLVNAGVTFAITARESASVQLVWSPPFALHSPADRETAG